MTATLRAGLEVTVQAVQALHIPTSPFKHNSSSSCIDTLSLSRFGEYILLAQDDSSILCPSFKSYRQKLPSKHTNSSTTQKYTDTSSKRAPISVFRTPILTMCPSVSFQKTSSSTSLREIQKMGSKPHSASETSHSKRIDPRSSEQQRL